ncbi:MAG: Tim44 domain-containing protein [Alphaproteobacteria bacterium]|nr:Tim44 domain-containing protein [Alphaproteobacteria bacterium]
MQFFDIIFFAAIAAFLVFRLWSVLGRRSGLDRRPPSSSSFWTLRDREDAAAPTKREDKVVHLPGRGPESETPARPAAAAQSPFAEAFDAMRKRDRNFSIEEFLAGARVAFETVVSAFAKGDKKTLRALLSKDVFSRFAAAIDARAAKEETLEVMITKISDAEVSDATLAGNIGRIVVRFFSEQIKFTRNKDGAIIEGDPNTVRSITDTWTFERDLRSRNPNWTLVATHGPA